MKMIDLLPFIAEAFEQNKTFTIPITGTSMLPLLVQGRDRVTLARPRLDESGKAVLSLGDLPLYRRKDGAFVLHRVVGISPDGTYTMCGDNQFILEEGIEPSQIIGVTVSLFCDGKELSAEASEYKKYVDKMCKNVKYRYPRRRLRYEIGKILKKH